ncbi:MAG: hypothetical protein ACOY4P_16895 [Pseudomonadota bacterium]
MTAESDLETLRKMTLMMEQGLETQTEPFPETDREFAQILDELRPLAKDDLEGKMVIGGFVDHPYGPDEQRCLECMYYLVHRKWCDLPELAVPVEPNWWCRLWRI